MSLENEIVNSYYPVLRYFDYSHLPDKLKESSKRFHNLAYEVARGGDNEAVARSELQHSEIVRCLNKLLEAKDCAVRSRIK